MNIRTLALLALSTPIILTGCGQNEADVILNDVHEKYMQNVAENAELLEQPEVGMVTGAFNLQTSPFKNLGSSKTSFEGSINLAIESTSRYDIRNTKDLLTETELSIQANVDAPAGTFGMPSQASGRDEAVLNLRLLARSAAKTLLLQIPILEANAPLLPSAFQLQDDVTNSWYGMTFEEINTSLREAQQNDADRKYVPKIEEIISNMFAGTRVSPKAMKRAGEKMHMWKGIEVLPEKDEMMQVRVVSDKKKILRSVKAAMEYIKEVSGPSWDAQLQNAEFKEMVTKLNKNDSEFLSTMGSVEGVLSIEKETYVVRGFDGDIMDESGAVTGHVSLTSTKEGDMELMLSNTDKSATVAFIKKGENISFTADNENLMIGTWKDNTLSLSFFDIEEKNIVATLKVVLESYDKKHLFIKVATLTIPDEKIAFSIEDLRIENKDTDQETSFSARYSATSEGKTFATGSITSSKKAIEPFSLEAPSFKPFEQLQADLYQAVLGGANDVMGDYEEGYDLNDDTDFMEEGF